METSLPLSEFQKICRICLKNDILVSIYSPTFLMRPIEMLEKLNILKLPLDETLPTLLCQSCLYRLLDAYNLQQLAEASERRLREYFGLPSSSSSSAVVSNCELHNADFIKPEADCSSTSMYANICDMFDRHDVTNDMVEVVGTDDVELLNDVEIDVSSLTRSEAGDTSLSDVFMSTKTKISFDSKLLTKNLESFKIDQEEEDLLVPLTQNTIDIKSINNKKSQKICKKRLKESLKTPDKCLECGKVFHYKGYLKIHKRIHTGEKPFKCEICSREFITSNKLLLHKRTHSNKNTTTTTTNTTNKNNDNMNNSINNSLTISSSTSLSVEKRFQCEICSAFFTTSSNLKSHKFTHSNQRTYQCKHCSIAFKSPRDLKRHESSHKTIKDIHCAICEKSFTKRASLNAHMITVHRRIRKHKCTDCDKTFGKRSNLINHMRIHSGERPFECSNCSWKFAQSSALKRHMKKHMKGSSTVKQ